MKKKLFLLLALLLVVAAVLPGIPVRGETETEQTDGALSLTAPAAVLMEASSGQRSGRHWRT